MTLVMLARAHDPDVLADVAGLVEFAVQCSSDPDRPSASCHLATRAGNRRRLLELHDVFADRLHQKSWDFDATRGLVMTISALRRVNPATADDSLGG
ncbi:MAG TPA: hypothetical protein VGN51_05015 [Acidimicrobiia bacterium]|jgi:hypothetical protein